MGAGTGALATGAGKAPGTTCRHESRSNASTAWKRWILHNIAYMHDQFIDHSPGGLRPVEPLAWAQARVLRPQGLAKLHVALPAGITSRDRRYQLYEKGGYCIHI